jgi:uncharacterized protein YqeY
MSELLKRVSADLTEAMKARDADRTRALRMIRAAFIEAEKSGAGPVNDDMLMDSLRRIRKQRVEAAEQYRAGGRPELAEAEEAEMRVIDGYLPQMADEATMRQWVKEAIAATGATSAKEAGKVTGMVMKAHKGVADAAVVKALAEKELGG